jgi:hypothetical protein
MTTESPLDADRTGPRNLPDGELVSYVDSELFEESTDSLERFTERKKTLAHPVRYAILYYAYVTSDGDKSARVPRKEFKRLLDREKNGLQTHMGPLLSANLLAECRAPEDGDGRQTFYRLTILGKREIESDLWNVRDERPE